MNSLSTDKTIGFILILIGTLAQFASFAISGEVIALFQAFIVAAKNRSVEWVIYVLGSTHLTVILHGYIPCLGENFSSELYGYREQNLLLC
jgi:hypothetical protein